MNLPKMLIGFVLFTGIIALFTGMAANLGSEYDSSNAAELSEKSTAYEAFTKQPTAEEQDTRQTLFDKIKAFAFDNPLANFVTSAVNSVIALPSYFGFFQEVTTETSNDVGVGDDSSINIIQGIIFSIVSIIIGFIVISMLMRVRPET